jgi:hypothetical protein
MKVSVTHLKAPWAAGTAVGDVVKFDGDTLPAWAVGKCTVLSGVPDEPVDASAEGAPAPASDEAQAKAAAADAEAKADTKTTKAKAAK